MRIRTLGLVLALVAVVALVGCSGGGSTTGGKTGGTSGGTSGGSTGGTTGGTTGGGTSGSSGATVKESGIAFDPASLTVSVGDTVTFTNEDSVPHQVLIDGKTLAKQSQGDSVTWTASKAGTYDYSCTVHPSMKGTIEVK